jgi:hypothetical protein
MLSLSKTKEPDPLPRPLNENALRQLITKAVDKGWVREGFHAEHERAYRNISMEDIIFGLEHANWNIVSQEYDATRKNWKYKIKTVDIEDAELVLLIAPDPDAGTVFVVTKF